MSVKDEKNNVVLNDLSPIPLYMQLKKDISEKIMNGTLPYGSKPVSYTHLPSRNTVIRSDIRKISFRRCEIYIIETPASFSLKMTSMRI